MRVVGRLERVLAVVGATAVLVVGVDSATYAKTGSSLILGKANKAGGVTTVKNTGPGAALRLTTRSAASPPFTTNATGRVANLYADRAVRADGLSGSALAQVGRTLASGTVVHVVGTAGEPPFAVRARTDTPEGWASYGSGYAPVSFRKDRLGVVNLGGLLCPLDVLTDTQSSCATYSGGAAGTFAGLLTVFTLPAGFRPAAREVFTVQDSDGSARIDVLPTGEVQIRWALGVSHSSMSLGGISFVAASA